MLTPRPRPFSRQPKPPVKRLPRSKYVTIAAGFRFDQGILLCADTQYSSAQKTHETKIFPIKYGDARLIFALTGRDAYARRAVERIEEQFQDIGLAELTRENLQNAIETGLRIVFENHAYLDPDWGGSDSPDFQFAIALYSPIDGTFLLKTERTIAFTVTDKVCLGTGAYLGDYLLKRLYLSSTQTLNDAVALATYVLHQTKAHDIYCGGASEFAILWNTGERSEVQSGDVSLNEKYAVSFDEFSKKIFYAVADLGKTDEEIYRAMATADEILFLSLTSRRETQEENKFVEELLQKFYESGKF
jgi:20S proteasome alpha/beta subunit